MSLREGHANFESPELHADFKVGSKKNKDNDGGGRDENGDDGYDFERRNSRLHNGLIDLRTGPTLNKALRQISFVRNSAGCNTVPQYGVKGRYGSL